MKFATFLFQTAPTSLAAIARKAEELNFESLWIPEHIVLPVKYQSPYPHSSSGRMPALPESPLHDPRLALASAEIGEGWYGIAETIADIRTTIARLREHERAAARGKPLELTVSPRLGEPLNLDHVKQFAEMGVSRIIFGAGPATKDQLEAMS